MMVKICPIWGGSKRPLNIPIILQTWIYRLTFPESVQIPLGRSRLFRTALSATVFPWNTSCTLVFFPSFDSVSFFHPPKYFYRIASWIVHNESGCHHQLFTFRSQGFAHYHIVMQFLCVYERPGVSLVPIRLVHVDMPDKSFLGIRGCLKITTR